MKGEFFFLLLFVIATSLLFCAAFATTAARLARIAALRSLLKAA